MNSLYLSLPNTFTSVCVSSPFVKCNCIYNYPACSTVRKSAAVLLYNPVKPAGACFNQPLPPVFKVQSFSTSRPGEGDEVLVEDLRIPESWLSPSKAQEESEWLRSTLHKWLDDEYCPEDTNVEISKVAASSLYNSLVEKETDIGVILLKMARDLESINYQESFHGAYTSANAAIDLVMRRIELS